MNVIFGIVQQEWRDVTQQLFCDLNKARERKDLVETNHIRQIFRAITSPAGPGPDLYCPLSLDIMDDPVTLVETSVTYDRKSIEKWLNACGSSSCPVSGKELNTAQKILFVDNKPLKSLTDDWKRQQMNKKVRWC